MKRSTAEETKEKQGEAVVEIRVEMELVSVENLLDQSRKVLSKAPQRFHRRKYVSSDSGDLLLLGREITAWVLS